ncbi:hypothetical protein ACJMK2_009700 [Sinanodonta woodiana]|uniref:Uncharacterized protein n=1 Tax=Sinanodonta woodiana TaxID=1069815 RepID=A0ABD3VE99_SINWO
MAKKDCCGKCELECDHDTIQCSDCCKWYHRRCTDNLSQQELTSWSLESLQFQCKECTFKRDEDDAGAALPIMMMSNIVGEKQGRVSFPLPRRVAKLNKPPPLRKATVKADDNIAVVPFKEVDTIKLKDDSSRNKSLSSVTEISSVHDVAEEAVRKRCLSKGLKLEKLPPLKTVSNDENKDGVKKVTTYQQTSFSPASMANKLINAVRQEMLAESEANNVLKKDITKSVAHGNRCSPHPRYQSQMKTISFSNLSSVGENGELLSFELYGQEKEAQNRDEVIESFVTGPKQFAINQPQSFNSLIHVPDTTEDLNNILKRTVLHQGQRMKANNFTQLCSNVNNMHKGPSNSIERWETKLNSSSEITIPDKYSGLITIYSRNGNQYTEANSHSQLHISANNTTTKVIKAVHGSEIWDLKSISQPNSYVTHSQFSISANENWETDLIDVNNNGFYPKIECSTLDKSIPNICQKNAPRNPVAKMDWENEIYDSDTSPEDETLCHDVNKNVGCPETRSKCDTDQFICVSDQNTPKAKSVINTVLEKDLVGLEISSLSDSYRCAESSYDTASSWSVSTEADGGLSCSTDEPLNETEWELIEDLSDRMQNISIHSPQERSAITANHSSQFPTNSLANKIKFENVKTCMPDDKGHAWELMYKTSIAQDKHFNSYRGKEVFSVRKDNSKRALVHIREPISPSSSADYVQKVEGTMPGIPFSAKWRRKMFAKYMRTIDMEVILDGDGCILQYSIEELVGYANSPSSLTMPSEWSYLTKVFPEVCLSKRLDFDHEKFLEIYCKGNTMDRFRYCRENTWNSQPIQYNIQDRDRFCMDHRNKEWSVTQPIRSGFGVPRQNSYEEFTANIKKDMPPIKSGFGVPRQNSHEEFMATIILNQSSSAADSEL